MSRLGGSGSYRHGVTVGEIAVERVQGDEETSTERDRSKRETADLQNLD
jgi:hypothetical protein